jgi:hypothetical protein
VLTVNPVLPDDWPGFSMVYRHRSATYEIAITAGPGPERDVELDGEKVGGGIPLKDDGATHRVTVRTGKRSGNRPAAPGANGISAALSIAPPTAKGLLPAPPR